METVPTLKAFDEVLAQVMPGVTATVAAQA
jgi:hypothetical protein